MPPLKHTRSSPSAVRSVLEFAPPALRTALGGSALVACIGRTTAEAAREAGLTVGVEPERAGAAQLAAALLRHVAEMSPHPDRTTR